MRKTFASRICALAIAAVVFFASATSAMAQRGYGVNANGDLFHFKVQSPNDPVINIGNLGFVPEGIDFRPGTGTLYAIDIGPNTTQLYTVDTSTGIPTPVGAGFNSSGALPSPYDLTTSGFFGFDFNPTTLQGDGSVRIRLVGNGGVNLRLNSDTGGIAAVDTALLYAAGDPVNPGFSPSIDAVAYLNSNASTSGGTTTLYGIDYRHDNLAIIAPPNAGTVNTVGALGVTVDALSGVHFDIFTDPTSNDPTIGGDFGYAVLKRTATAGGAYLFYGVNLSTGSIFNGALVGIGGGGSPADFTGGLAITVPEPSSLVLVGVGAALLAFASSRRRKA